MGLVLECDGCPIKTIVDNSGRIIESCGSNVHPRAGVDDTLAGSRYLITQLISKVDLLDKGEPFARTMLCPHSLSLAPPFSEPREPIDSRVITRNQSCPLPRHDASAQR